MHHVHESSCKKMLSKLSLLGICFGSCYAKIDLKNLKQGKAAFMGMWENHYQQADGHRDGASNQIL